MNKGGMFTKLAPSLLLANYHSDCDDDKNVDEKERILRMSKVDIRVFQKTQSISDQVPLLVCSVTIISKTSLKKLDHFDEN